MKKNNKKKELSAPQPQDREVVHDTDSAADYVGLSPATLPTLRNRGGGPVFVKMGSRVGYLQSDLDAYLRARRVRSTAGRPIDLELD